jgi:hypothetical protein
MHILIVLAADTMKALIVKKMCLVCVQKDNLRTMDEKENKETTEQQVVG